MDIHKPKPVHSWREFLNEITIIIIGVLIALGLEQAVEQWHWHNEVAEARESLREEIAANLRNYEFNVRNRNCTLANIVILKKLVKERNVAAVQEAMTTENLLKAGFHQYGLNSTVWETVNASGMLAHMQSKERLDFAGVSGLFANERIFRIANYNIVIDLSSKAADFDGSAEASRDLLHDLAAIDYFYRNRVAEYEQNISDVAQYLDVKPAKQNPKEPFWCHPLQPSGKFS